jgi:NAD(P)-dependent dehydrogenase (short-subunit alcohol dehydrogenase family)
MSSSSSHRVLLILGAGKNVGQYTAAKFSENGYKVALAARSLTTTSLPTASDTTLHIKADVTVPSDIIQAFSFTTATFGAPNIVVYNGAIRLTTPPDDPLFASLDDLKACRAVSVDGAYIAAQQALASFRQLPKDVPTAFLFTGNALNQLPIPGVMPFAVAKVAAAMIVEYAANAYGALGYRYELTPSPIRSSIFPIIIC